MDILASPNRKPLHALFIPHILASVVRLLDKGSQASCACVCRAWYATVVDILWQSLEDPWALFLLIKTFPDRLISASEKDWERFIFHAQRVKTLEFKPGRVTPLDADRLNKIALLKPMHYLTPNVTHLTWTTKALPIIGCLLFFSPKLVSLILQIHRGRRYQMYGSGSREMEDFEFLSTAASRCPHLETFELRTMDVWGRLQDSARIFISQLKALKVIRLHWGLFKKDTWSMLASIHTLEAVMIAHDADYDNDNDTDSEDEDGHETYDSQITLSNAFPQPGAFSALKHLQLKTSIEDIAAFLDSTPNPPPLQSLDLLLAPNDVHGSAEKLFAKIGQHMSFLTSLGIESGNGSCTRLSRHTTTTLPIDILEPLTVCTQLRRLSLKLPWAIGLSVEPLSRMLKSWPEMEELRLFPFTDVKPVEGPFLPIGIIPSIIRDCPRMHSLGLLLDPSDASPAFGVAEIPQLQELDLRFTSNKYNAEDVTIFLAQLTPSTCKIMIEHFTWFIGEIDEATETDSSDSSDSDGEPVTDRRLRKERPGVVPTTVTQLLPYVRRIHFRYKSQMINP